MEKNDELPHGWEEIDFHKSVKKIPLTGKKLKQKSYQETGKLPVIDQGKESVGGFTDRMDLKLECKLPVIVFGDHTKVVKYVDKEFVAGADGVTVLEPREIFIPKLLFYFIKAIPLPHKGYARHYQFLEKSLIKIPPLNEQKRIVAKIEELFSILDHAKNSLEFNILQINLCKRAILKKVIEETLTQDEICTNLQNVCTKVTDGTHNPPKFVKNGIQFIFVKNIVDGKLNLDTKKFITSEDYQFLSKRCPIEIGDILYSVVGSYGVAVQVDTQKQFQFQRHISLLKPNPKFLNSEYLVFVMNSPFVLSQAHKASRGVAQKTVNLSDLRKFLIPCPTLNRQQEIVKTILLQFSLLDNILKIIKPELIRIKNTYTTILKLAFEGKLVPQDPNDEPASELLKRIKN